MTNYNNVYTACSRTTVAAIVSAIIGVIAAFLQITAAITVAPTFLFVMFGILGTILLSQSREPIEVRGLRAVGGILLKFFP